MKVVEPTGTLLTGHNSFDWGCSHSGFQRIVWDATAARFVMVCRSDTYPQVGLNANATNLILAIDASNSSVGNVVLASGGGYWVLVSNTGTLHLLRFTTGAATTDLNLGSGNYPHLATYGTHLLAAWPSGSSLTLTVLDASTGATVGSPLSAAVTGNRCQEFKSFPDGSAAYPALGRAPTRSRSCECCPANSGPCPPVEARASGRMEPPPFRREVTRLSPDCHKRFPSFDSERVERSPAMTPLYWLTERPALFRAAIAVALVTWGAVIVMSVQSLRHPQADEVNGQCVTTLVGPLG